MSRGRSLASRQQNVPAVTIRCFLKWYLFQVTRVAWDGSYSHDIIRYLMVLVRVQYWVLLCIYFDELIHALEPAKYECYIGFCFVCVLSYTNDLMHVSCKPNLTGNMLKICDEFGERYSVIFKSLSPNVYCVYLLIDHVACLMPQLLSSISVAMFVYEWSHLRHVISTSGDDMHDDESRKSSLIGQINGTLRDFRNVTCNIEISLIKTYCTSPGAELWDLSND